MQFNHTTKTCTNCLQLKPISDFSLGLPSCDSCHQIIEELYIEYQGRARIQWKVNHAKWYILHRAEKKAYDAAWRAKNPDKAHANWNRYQARKKGAPISDLTAEQWETIKATYQYRCAYCGRKPKKLTQDHVVPLSKGGSHTASNIVPACHSCNSKKHTSDPPTFQRMLCPLSRY